MLNLSKGAKILVALLALSTASAVIPADVPLVGISQAQAWRHHHRHHRHYRHHRHHDGGNAAAAGIIGGIIGLGVGAAIANQPAPRRVYSHPRPWTREWYAYCSRKYRSFDPRSGTFQPYHGPRKLCR